MVAGHQPSNLPGYRPLFGAVGHGRALGEPSTGTFGWPWVRTPRGLRPIGEAWPALRSRHRSRFPAALGVARPEGAGHGIAERGGIEGPSGFQDGKQGPGRVEERGGTAGVVRGTGGGGRYGGKLRARGRTRRRMGVEHGSLRIGMRGIAGRAARVAAPAPLRRACPRPAASPRGGGQRGRAGSGGEDAHGEGQVAGRLDVGVDFGSAGPGAVASARARLSSGSPGRESGNGLWCVRDYAGFVAGIWMRLLSSSCRAADHVGENSRQAESKSALSTAMQACVVLLIVPGEVGGRSRLSIPRLVWNDHGCGVDLSGSAPFN